MTLREAALQWLSDHAQVGSQRVTVVRATFEIEVDGRTELVALATGSDGSLQAIATGVVSEAAIASLLREWHEAEIVDPSRNRRTTRSSVIEALRNSQPPVAASVMEDERKLAEALEDLMVGIVRQGVSTAETSVTVSTHLAALAERCGAIGTVFLERFVGRMRQALALKDAVLVARQLDDASSYVSAARTHDDANYWRVLLWTKSLAQQLAEPIIDRSLVEIGRESVAGLARGSIRRRYLLCVRTGEIFCEEGRRESTLSLGPFGRRLNLGFGQVHACPGPRRLTVQQYSIEVPTDESVSKVIHESAKTGIPEVVQHYRDAMRVAPGLAEPVAIFAPAGQSGDALLDAEGRRLPLKLDAAVAQRLQQIQGLQWMAGRLDDIGGVVVLDPFSYSAGGRLERLR